LSTHPFVHLHFHTEYSLLDGACHVGEVMDAAQRMGMPAVAITDHGVLFGVIDFYKSAKKKGIKPIIGCEVYVAPEGMSMTERRRSETGSQSNHLVLLAESAVGYDNLCHLVSHAHLEGFYYKPRIDHELLAKHSRGLIGLSACLKGEIPEKVTKGMMREAEQLAGTYKDILGPGNFFIELQDHGIPEQKVANRGLLEISRKLDLPLVCTNDVHYLDPEHWEAHDVMICLQTQTVMSDPNRMKYGSRNFYMRSGEEMHRLFHDHPEALANTLAIAERCHADLNLSDEPRFPTYEVPEGQTQKQYLLKLAQEGLQHRYGRIDVFHPRNDDEKKIADRFKHEFEVIEKTGFINYFLVVWDFIRFARERGIPVGPGRGSGAGSIIAYALGITGIDPLRYHLIFERFLNPERVSPPDFDIDFCQARRGEVIEYVKQKYGRENVAQIITFGTLGAKTVIRDIGRVLEIPLPECDRLAKMIPEDPGTTLESALAANPEFKRTVETDENARRIMKYARVLEGLPRNPGTHAAGVVIGDKPLIDILPLTRDKDKEVVTQFEMKPLEEVGLLKMDFLGLRTLTLIQESVENIRRVRGVEVDVDALPMDDEATFGLLNRGDTVGVFQVESKGMRDLLRRIGLTRFEDLIAMIALFRPGPMNMLDDYVNRKHGKVKSEVDHPLLEPILKETYGVMLYQEQVQQAANVLAGFTLGQGDLLRRAMGKKIKEEMAAQRDRFVKGCWDTNRIPKAKAERIFDNIERFAGYGFNKSHSAAYAVLSWQTAYLKAHYPVEFLSALLSSEINNSDKLPILLAEAQQMGIKVLPPNVNDSEVRFKPSGEAIRFGLAGVKNVGTGAVEALIREREANGAFKGLVDFCNRMDSQLVNKKVLESLVKCGAFDFTEMSRGRLFSGIEFAMNRASAMQRDRRSGQGSLFDMLGERPEASDTDDLPAAPPWPESEMLAGEKELLGFYISGHPLTQYQWALNRFGLMDLEAAREVQGRMLTRIGGLVSHLHKRFTKKTQEAMAVFQLERLDGRLEVVAFPDTYRDFGVHLLNDAAVMVCGEIERVDADNLRMIASEIYPLREVHHHFADRLSLHIPAATADDDKLTAIRDVLRGHPGPTQVVLCLVFPNGEKVFINTDRSHTTEATEDVVRTMERILGENSVYLAVRRNPCKRNGNGRNGKSWGRGGGRMGEG